MVIFIGLAVTVLYFLLGACLVRVSALGISSSIITRSYTPIFTLYVPVAIVITNILAVGMYNPVAFRSMDFVYINVLPVVMLANHLIRYINISNARNRAERMESRARDELQAWIDQARSTVDGLDIRSHVYFSNGQLRGSIVVRSHVELSDDIKCELARSVPKGLNLEFLQKK